MKETKYICDRCGKMKDKHVRINFPIKDKIIEDISWITLRSGTGYKRNIDLCDDCIKSFVNWFSSDSTKQS